MMESLADRWYVALYAVIKYDDDAGYNKRTLRLV